MGTEREVGLGTWCGGVGAGPRWVGLRSIFADFCYGWGFNSITRRHS